MNKLFVIFIYVHLVIEKSHQEDALLESTEGTDDESVLGDIVDGETAYTDDNDNYEPTETYYEPFDPEKNGFLLHEYFDQAYEKYPDYDTTTMKLNLNYFGDVLLFDKNKNYVAEEFDAGDRFTLDPEEKELYLKESEETNDIQEATNDIDEVDGEQAENDDTDSDTANENEYDSIAEENQGQSENFWFDNESESK